MEGEYMYYTSSSSSTWCCVFLDIDECEAVDNGICEQKCINNRGSYTCDCRESFVIGNDAQRYITIPQESE